MSEDHSTVASADAPAATLLELGDIAAAAARAPSGDNMQPWRIATNQDEKSIEIHLDSTRDYSPMNSGQRMSLIACGAAIENALIVARELGFEPALELLNPVSAESGTKAFTLIARIRMKGREQGDNSNHFSKTIRARVVNRKLYDRRPISPIVLSELADSTPPAGSISTLWISARTNIERLAEIISRGDAVMFGEPRMRHAFLSNVRFDLPAHAEADEGLPLASLETSSMERIGMRLMKKIPNALFAAAGGRSVFAAKARKLVRSASGLCIVAVMGNVSHAEVRTGQAMQRAWLALTELGLSAQPMMSLMVLDNALRHGHPELIAALNFQKTDALLSEFKSALNELGIQGRPAFLLRFGYASPPSGRTGRLKVIRE